MLTLACVVAATAATVVVVRPWRVRLLVSALCCAGPPEHLRMPVKGVRPEALRSTFGAPRSGGRKHEGIDIFAPRGTPVVSATRGTVWKVGHDRLGGKVVMVLGEGPAFYYYAHLDRHAPGLKRGMRVEPGTRLGTVGNTGNARNTPPHLHFGVYPLRLRGLFGARAVDPYPLLTRGRDAYAALVLGRRGVTTTQRP